MPTIIGKIQGLAKVIVNEDIITGWKSSILSEFEKKRKDPDRIPTYKCIIHMSNSWPGEYSIPWVHVQWGQCSRSDDDRLESLKNGSDGNGCVKTPEMHHRIHHVWSFVVRWLNDDSEAFGVGRD